MIDHGHFQYNCVSLGLALFAIGLAIIEWPFAASILFMMAICYKQIALYLAPAFFFFLLGQSLKATTKLGKTGAIAIRGVAVVLTLIATFSPFLHNQTLFLQVIRRIFPFERGLFEDKVSNFWCVSNVFFKWREHIDLTNLIRLSTLLTGLSLLPNAYCCIISPTPLQFIYSLSTSALSFFLFSFHVHEKSILFAVLPISLLSYDAPIICQWFGRCALFSLFPLLEKDGLELAYFCHMVIYQVWSNLKPPSKEWSKVSYISFLCFVLELCVHILSIWIPSSGRFPDLVPLIFAIVSGFQFGVIWLILNWIQLNNAVSDLQMIKDQKKNQ
jgi:alpha-1,3-glucosyltransferase